MDAWCQFPFLPSIVNNKTNLLFIMPWEMQRKNAKCTIIGSFNSYIILASLSFCHFKLCVCFFLTFFLVWISLFLNPNICFLAWQTRLHPRWWEEQIIISSPSRFRICHYLCVSARCEVSVLVSCLWTVPLVISSPAYHVSGVATHQ